MFDRMETSKQLVKVSPHYDDATKLMDNLIYSVGIEQFDFTGTKILYHSA